MFRSGAAVAQVTVNHLVAGSNPAFGANLTPLGESLEAFFVSQAHIATGALGQPKHRKAP